MKTIPEVYSHGIGSAGKGNEYHHEVYHLVNDGITLCGVYLRGRDWWKEYMSPDNFLNPERRHKIYAGDSFVCKRCAKIWSKE